MRRTQAIGLRQQWLAQGNLLCEHPVAVLERTEADYLTGNLVCATCGAEFRRLIQPEPTTLSMPQPPRDPVEQSAEAQPRRAAERPRPRVNRHGWRLIDRNSSDGPAENRSDSRR